VLRPLAALLAVALVSLSGCSGLNEHGHGRGATPTGKGAPPQISAESGSKSATEELGFPVTATKNTTRVAGADTVADVAGAVSAVFPATAGDNRPHAVAIVDKGNWPDAIAASVLMAKPLGIPILLSDRGKLPAVSGDVLARLKPTGSPLAQNAQIVRIGDGAAQVPGYRTAIVPGTDIYEVAAGIDRFFSVARAKPSPDVVVASGQQAGFAMPAAAWAARSGDTVLFVTQNSIPAFTRSALRRHSHPRIWVLGPSSAIGSSVVKALGKYGSVRRIDGITPVQNAIAFTRFQSHGFGWGITTPGQNFTVASTGRPADAAGAAVLATAGVFAPLLLTDRADPLPSALENYFLDVQPGFQSNPNAGVFNHVWILGDAGTLSVSAQGRLDTITELVPVQSQQP
jgi:putative cell wall binding repeat protein